MACRTRPDGLSLFFYIIIFSTFATASPADFTSFNPIHKAVSEAAYPLISNLGWNDKEVKISYIDTVDAKFGQTVVYEFDIELGEDVIPLRLSEDITIWKYMEELPTGISESSDASPLRASQSWQLQDFVANLGPFQLSGPVELWIQDAELLRLAVPDDDIEAGDLKKVILSDGAVVTVEGAQEVSLARPIRLPLPLRGISKDDGVAASLLALADRLRYASRAEEKPLLTLKIGGATTSMVASSIDSRENALKVERLEHGVIKLEKSVQEQQEEEVMSGNGSWVSAGKRELGEEQAWMWPVPSVSVWETKLIDLEEVLLSAMGPSVYKKGYFNLLRAKVSMATFVRVEFQLERKLSEDSFPESEVWPHWRTKPSVERLQFEMVAMMEGQDLIPISVQGVKAYANIETASWSALRGNVSHSKMTRIYLPPSTMTLNPNWEDLMY